MTTETGDPMKTEKLAAEKWLVKVANWDGTASTLNVCKTQAEANAWVHKYSEGEEDAPYYVEHYA